MNSELTQALFFQVIPQVGTPLYDLAKEINAEALENQLFQEYSGVNSWYAKTFGINLDKLRRWAYLRLYLTNPKRIWRIWRAIRSCQAICYCETSIIIFSKCACASLLRDRQTARAAAAGEALLLPLVVGGRWYAQDETSITSATVLHSKRHFVPLSTQPATSLLAELPAGNAS